jgi:hypothetical protein
MRAVDSGSIRHGRGPVVASIVARQSEALGMTDKMLFPLSIFLTGLGAGIALAVFAAPHSRPALRIGRKCDEDLPQGKAAAAAH